jgi:hypothetical protein
MDIYLFVLWLVGITGSLVILAFTLWYLGIKPQTRKLIEESKKLQLKVNQFKSEIGEYGGGGGEGLVKGVLGEIGVEGIMNELGIDPKLLNNPLVKGLIDKYAPKLIEKLNKGGEGNEQTQPFGKGFL